MDGLDNEFGSTRYGALRIVSKAPSVSGAQMARSQFVVTSRNAHTHTHLACAIAATAAAAAILRHAALRILHRMTTADSEI